MEFFKKQKNRNNIYLQNKTITKNRRIARWFQLKKLMKYSIISYIGYELLLFFLFQMRLKRNIKNFKSNLINQNTSNEIEIDEIIYNFQYSEYLKYKDYRINFYNNFFGSLKDKYNYLLIHVKIINNYFK